jgi:hypothetical protein
MTEGGTVVEGIKGNDGTLVATYTGSSEVVPLPKVAPVTHAHFPVQRPERKPKQPARKDTVTISDQALQMAREGVGEQEG